MEVLRLISLALSSFALGFFVCNAMYVFSGPSSKRKRDDGNDKAARGR